MTGDGRDGDDHAVTHPAASLSLDERVAYLRAVSALVSVDSNIAEAELDSIHHLADELAVDRAVLDIDAFAKDPDIAMVEDELSRAENLGLAHALLTDAITIAFADGRIDPNESKVLAHYAHRLHIPIAQAGVIARYVAQTHAQKDGEALSHELVEEIAEAERVQSPGFVRRMIDRLRGRRS